LTRLLLQLLLAATTATVLVPLAAAPAAAEPNIEFECTDHDTPDSNDTPYYDARFEPGQPLPQSVLDEYIPQGLTTWRNYGGPGEDLLVYTAYHEDGGDRRAVIQGVNPSNGLLTNVVEIGMGHAGGVAIHGDWAYVSAPDKKVRRYGLENLRDHFTGAKTGPMDGRPAGDVVGPASFLAVDGDTLFVGKHDKDKRSSMHRYQIDPENGTISGPVGDSIRVPMKTQGLLVLKDHFVYSTSRGRDNRSNIYVVGRGYRQLEPAFEAGQLECFKAPSMSEGITISQGRVYLVFESGASYYENNEDGSDLGAPDRVIKDLQSVDRDLLPLSP